MKKKLLIFLPLIVVVILFAACPAAPPLDEAGAAGKFIDWLTGQGIPAYPETPMVGLDLGAVPSGSQIGSHSPFPQDQLASVVSRGTTTLSEAGWLFYLDEQPGGFYEHPGRIVVVGSKGNILHSESIVGWPTVNGVRPSALDSPTSGAFHAAMVWNPWGYAIPWAGIKDWTVFPLFQRIKGAVVVDGLVSGDSLYTEALAMHGQVVTDMQSLFTVDNVRSVASPTVVANPAQRIRNAVDDLVTNRDVNNITLYMIAHGSIDSIGVGGYSYNINNLRTLISDYPNVRFAVLLETCHGGSWLDNFNGALAGYPVLDNLGIFITSTSSDKGAYPDWDSATTGTGSTIYDYDTTDAYVEWTSDFLKRLATWSTGANYTTVSAYATSKEIEKEWALYYYCYWKVKGSGSVPPAPGFLAPTWTYTLTERQGVAVQAPQIYQKWTP